MSACCPIDHADGRLFLEIEGFEILECSECGHRFLDHQPVDAHTEEHYGDRYFYEGGAGYSDYTIGEKLLVSRGRYYAKRLAKHCKRPGRLLDVGCAAGYLMRGFSSRGWKCEGIEPNHSMAATAERAGLRTYLGGIEDTEPEGTYDVVSMVQVVAHLRDLDTAFERANALLEPGGKLLIETWNSASWTAKLLGRRWHEYSPPTVLNWFTRNSLRRFVENHGFRQIDSRMTVKSIGAGQAASILKHKARHSRLVAPFAKAMDMLPERLALPYPADDLFWAIFEKPGVAVPEERISGRTRWEEALIEAP